jgi:ankyrin repeat protein
MDAGNFRTMGRTNLHALAAGALAICAVPVAAQTQSESLTFLKGVRSRNAETVTTIVNNPSSTAINARDSTTGEGALHILVRGRDLTWLNFLMTRGARPDLQSNDGTTPLILAAQLGWHDGAEALLARRANANLGNRNGETPLIFAVQRRDLPMVRLLLGQGANPNQTDNLSGYSAIDYARQDRRAAAILRELESSPTPAG